MKMDFALQSSGRKTILTLVVTVCLSSVSTAAVSQTTQNEPFDITSPDRAMIEHETKEILKRPEFRHLTRERQISSDSPFDLKELIKDEPETTTSSNDFFLASFLGTTITVLSYISIVCACGVILYLLYRSLVGFKFSKKMKDKSHSDQLQGELRIEEIISPAESEASTYLKRAKELAQTGDYQNAIVQLLYGSMSFIERSGWIRFRKGLTYRDYLRASRPHGLPCESFRQMIRTYEPLGFGRREATREHFESTLSHYEAAFQKKA